MREMLTALLGVVLAGIVLAWDAKAHTPETPVVAGPRAPTVYSSDVSY